jgi:murein L,D-transpeptidase YcbB/YkuD
MLCCVVGCIFGCRETTRIKEEPSIEAIQDNLSNAKQTVAGNFSSQMELHFDSAALPTFLIKYPGFASYSTDLKRFYEKRKYAFAWYDSSGLIEQAGNLFNRSQHLNQEGLNLKLPYNDSFKALMEGTDSTLRIDPRNAEAELMLTAQYFSFARHVWQGMGEAESRKTDWFLSRKVLDLEMLMDSLLSSSKKAPGSREPVYRQYALLKNFLKKYRDIDSAGGWKPIATEKKFYKMGDSTTVIREIRKRLFASGDYVGDTSSLFFSQDLEDAVKSFQQTRGLKEDGIIGRALINELNIPVRDIIEKIVLNMERSRWVPVRLEGDYLVVNIPAFKLYVYRNDSLLWDMNIVAGKIIHETVVFNGDLKYIVFSPYWNVPQSIFQNEVLPGMKQDSNYLAKHNMEKVGRNSVRQKPGPNNSLGQVKFLFPNSYNIYLHDTPSKSLFNKTSRAFSHGCIRLGEPKKLATYLLRDDPGWNEQKIDLAMNSGIEKYVTLKKSVPVFIAYFTAWVGREGKLNLRPDIYNRDNRLAEMMFTEN